jgi:hypothetical protein
MQLQAQERKKGQSIALLSLTVAAAVFFII